MKFAKRTLAIVLVVLMLAVSIPFAASAAGETYTLKLTSNKAGFTYKVYKLAVVDETNSATSGQYVKANANVNAAIMTAINNSTASTAGVLAACKNVPEANLGDVVGTFQTASGTATYSSLPAGIYFVKNTVLDTDAKDVAQDSIVVLPFGTSYDPAAAPYKDTAWDAATNTFTLDVAKKVRWNDQPDVSKKVFDKKTSAYTTETSASKGEAIQYRLTADITATKDNKLTAYFITDKMDEMLDATKIDIKSVKVFKDTTSADVNYKLIKNTDTTMTQEEATAMGDNTFIISVDKASALDTDAFYNNDYVEVIFTTQLADNAAFATAIPNTDGLVYSNASGSKTVPGDTVNVYTYGIQVIKKDADNTTKLGGAVFGIYSDQACRSEIAQVTTGDGKNGTKLGEGIFDYKFAEGTYYIKELVAPVGYNLNTHVYPVTITKDSQTLSQGIDVSTEILDTKTKLPETGGEGTMIFTIIGGSLILLAGALFVVVLKKRNSK
jgi:LPXTG-motif cell wall-anchored protein